MKLVSLSAVTVFGEYKFLLALHRDYVKCIIFVISKRVSRLGSPRPPPRRRRNFDQLRNPVYTAPL